MTNSVEQMRQLARDIDQYTSECLAYTNNYNRLNDTDYTVIEARAKGVALSHFSLDAFMHDKYPGKAHRRAKKDTQAHTRTEYQNLSLKRKMQIMAVTHLAAALKAHATNLKEFELALEEEMESEDMGSFG